MRQVHKANNVEGSETQSIRRRTAWCLFADLTHLGREKARADADFYKAQKQSEAYKVAKLILIISALVKVFFLVHFQVVSCDEHAFYFDDCCIFDN